MKLFTSIFVIAILLFTTVQLQAQVSPAQEAMIQAELQKRGLKEEEVRVKFEERGIDIDNMSPEEALGLQSVFEEIEKEIKAGTGAGPVTDTNKVTDEKAVLEKVDNALDKLDGVADETTIEAVEEAVKAEAKGTGIATADDVIAEKLAEETISDLPPTTIYGQQLFRDKTLAVFSRSNEIIPGDAYILGPGDDIAISIFGVSQFEGAYTIKAGGFIQPDGMSRINLKGISLGKARELLRRRFGQFYRFNSGEMAITVSKTRDITVNIYGEVYNPGSYNIRATNTAFNALVASGGPTDIGSVRSIRLFRGGEKPVYIDVYEYMMNPVAKAKYALQDNDIIQIDEVEKVVSIRGAVKRPFKYELLDSENLIKLIDYAGGFQKNAYLNAIQLKRFENNEEKLIDVDLKKLRSGNSDFKLLDGDEIVVRTIARPIENYVEIVGAVDFPSKYEYRKGDKVSDLLTKGILKDDARKDIAYLIRIREDKTVKYEKINIAEILANSLAVENILLQPFDQITILSTTTYIDINNFSIGGAVRNPRTVQFDPEESVKVEDAVLLAGGLKVDAQEDAYIVRTNTANTKDKEYIKFNIRNAMLNPASDDNIILKPLDKITVYSVEGFTDAATVSIDGSVRQPGEYAYDDGLRVSDLIYFSSGLTLSATDFAIIHRRDLDNEKKKGYLRINVREAMENPASESNVLLQPNDRIQIFRKESYTDESTVLVQGAVRQQGEITYDETLTLRDALTLAGGLKPEAASDRIEIFRVVFQNNQPTKTTVAVLSIDENAEVEGDDIQLQPFDQVVVRTVPDFEMQQMVTVKGEVKFPGAYALLDKNERLSSVIARSGGVTKEGFPEGTILIRSSEEGNIITKLDEVLKSPNSNTNYILKSGDIIDIPKRKDLVGIKTGNTKAAELYPDRVLASGQINVPYHKGKRARYYVNEYAVGIGENGQRSRITVEHPNGEFKRTKRFLFFTISPKVKEGSIVTVGAKAVKPKKEREEKEGRKSETDWEKIVGTTVAQVTGILSLVLLLQQIN